LDQAAAQQQSRVPELFASLPQKHKTCCRRRRCRCRRRRRVF